MKNTSLRLLSWADIYLETPRISINGINIGTTIWEIVNLSVSMINSNTNLLMLNAYTSSPSIPNRSSVYVTMENTVLGHCYFEGISSIKVTNCSFTGRNYTKSLLVISDSTVAFDRISMSNGIFAQAQFLAIVQSSSVTMRNSYFFNNEIIGNVGLIEHIENSTLAVETCRFVHNFAPKSFGGIIHSETSFLRIESSFFENNYAWVGGVIYLINQTVMEILKSLFTNNVAYYLGGSFSGYANVHISIHNSTFTGNSVPGWHGGAIEVGVKSTLNITNCVFSKNFANGVAGLISVFNDSTVCVSRTVFESNKAVSMGGAINLQHGAAFICSDSLFFNNTAAAEVVTLGNYGGAINGGTNSTLHVRRINFTENTASQSGGAIYMSGSKSGRISESSFNKNVGSACSFSQSVKVVKLIYGMYHLLKTLQRETVDLSTLSPTVF